MDEGRSTEDIAEGAEPEETERYDLAGNLETLVAGIVRYVEKRREKE